MQAGSDCRRTQSYRTSHSSSGIFTRPGDPAVLIASSKKSRELGWKPMHSNLTEIIASAWDWMKAYPEGHRAEDHKLQPCQS
jgi:nucleoside-diphosphate-sugar epimerase